MADNPASESETYEFTITTADGDSETVSLPRQTIDLLREPDESPTAVIGDFAMLMAAQQLHGMVHHGEMDPDEELQAIETATMEAFQERFGQSFEEMLGHSH